MTQLHDEKIMWEAFLYRWSRDQSRYVPIQWETVRHYIVTTSLIGWDHTWTDPWWWLVHCVMKVIHYNDIIMGTMASQITSLTFVYSTVYSGADQRHHQSSASLAFVWGIHRGPVNSPHKWPVTRKMFPFDGVIMCMHKAASFSTQQWNFEYFFFGVWSKKLEKKVDHSENKYIRASVIQKKVAISQQEFICKCHLKQGEIVISIKGLPDYTDWSMFVIAFEGMSTQITGW